MAKKTEEKMSMKQEILGITENLLPSKKVFSLSFKLLKREAVRPTKNVPSDAGLDLSACESVWLPPFTRKLIGTGVAWQPSSVPEGNHVFMKLEGRSGNALKKGFAVLGGVVDQNYRGEIKVVLLNTSWWFKKVNVGDKIAQGVVHMLPNYTFSNEEFVDTDRGDKGFGSSGK